MLAMPSGFSKGGKLNTKYLGIRCADEQQRAEMAKACEKAMSAIGMEKKNTAPIEDQPIQIKVWIASRVERIFDLSSNFKK